MLFGRVGGFEAQLISDFGAGGWCAGLCNRVFDERENLLLAGSEFGGF